MYDSPKMIFLKENHTAVKRDNTGRLTFFEKQLSECIQVNQTSFGEHRGGKTKYSFQLSGFHTTILLFLEVSYDSIQDNGRGQKTVWKRREARCSVYNTSLHFVWLTDFRSGTLLSHNQKTMPLHPPSWVAVSLKAGAPDCAPLRRGRTMPLPVPPLASCQPAAIRTSLPPHLPTSSLLPGTWSVASPAVSLGSGFWSLPHSPLSVQAEVLARCCGAISDQISVKSYS